METDYSTKKMIFFSQKCQQLNQKIEKQGNVYQSTFEVNEKTNMKSLMS